MSKLTCLIEQLSWRPYPPQPRPTKIKRTHAAQLSGRWSSTIDPSPPVWEISTRPRRQHSKRFVWVGAAGVIYRRRPTQRSRHWPASHSSRRSVITALWPKLTKRSAETESAPITDGRRARRRRSKTSLPSHHLSVRAHAPLTSTIYVLRTLCTHGTSRTVHQQRCLERRETTKTATGLWLMSSIDECMTLASYCSLH